MKYLCMAYYDVEAFKRIDPAAFKAITSQCPPKDQALAATGAMSLVASLDETAAKLRPQNGKTVVSTDGPYIETKEQIGAVFIIEAENLEKAIAIASLHPAATLGEQVGWGVELRPIDYFKQY